VSVAKLMLEPDSIVYDVGAGTGSVAVESACFAQKGQVYALEKNPEALKLIDINRKKAGCGNITIVEGEAPSVFDKLPAPTHAFIGGSGGRLKEILSALYAKNPDMNIVVNALTLETQAEILSYIKEHNLAQAEITTVQVARGESVAAYHLMRGENPVMIVKL
jgi:precorrin-6Y C5,15-methyltransferase (decarboxylating)